MEVFFGDHGLHVRGDVREDHGKFVSADSGRIVGGAEAGFKKLCHSFEDPISHLMSVAVVDQLEFVSLALCQCISK